MGGVESYLESSNWMLDQEVDRGLVLLEQPHVTGVLKEVRRDYHKNRKELPESVEELYWQRFFDALGNFEEALACKLVNCLEDARP